LVCKTADVSGCCCGRGTRATGFLIYKIVCLDVATDQGSISEVSTCVYDKSCCGVRAFSWL
jgi:hypothetical protein